MLEKSNPKKTEKIICEKCRGKGYLEVRVCEDCGTTDNVGETVGGRYLCQLCYFGDFSEEEIKSF